MDVIDNVFGMDWTESQYVGDGVYVMDSTDKTGIPSVAIRTDRTAPNERHAIPFEKGSFNFGKEQHHVIIFEDRLFEDLVRMGRGILDKQQNLRALRKQEQETGGGT